MRLGSCLIPATLAAGFGLLALCCSSIAQEPGPGPTVASAEEPPEAPRPQFELAAFERGALQAPAAQSQTTPQPAPASTPAQTRQAQTGVAQGSSSSQATAQQPATEKSQR